METTHAIELQVRDYECDLTGVVNNSVYQNYFEHARHEFLKTLGVDFAQLAEEGIALAVVRIEIDYKKPLRSGEHFAVRTSMQRNSKVRFQFDQEITSGENILNAKGVVIGTALNARGRPFIPESINALMIDEVAETP